MGNIWPFDYILWEKLKFYLLKIFLIPLLWNNFKQVKTAIRYQIQKKNQISTFSISVQFYSIFYFAPKILYGILCIKIVRVSSYSGPHYLTLGLKTERYSVSIRIQSESGKMRIWITPNRYTFYTVTVV